MSEEKHYLLCVHICVDHFPYWDLSFLPCKMRGLSQVSLSQTQLHRALMPLVGHNQGHSSELPMTFENIVCPCLILRYSWLSTCGAESGPGHLYKTTTIKIYRCLQSILQQGIQYVMLIGAPDTSALDVFNVIMYISDHQQVLLLDILQGVRTNTY